MFADLEKYVGSVVCVTGGRHCHEQLWIERVLSFLKPKLLMHGACPTGADHYADEWAIENHTPVSRYHADWITYGHSAGRLRNLEMAQARPDVVIAFPGAEGTKHLIEVATMYGIPVITTEQQHG